MAGSLTFTVGPITATKTLSASNANLEAAVRRAVEELGYEGDASNDPAQTVADWFIVALVKYAKDASTSNRITAAINAALITENAVIDPFDG